MNTVSTMLRRLVAAISAMLFLFPAYGQALELLRFEIFGGISFINPKDFNLFGRAEEKYNDIYFIQRLRWMNGYFVNDFPEIRSTLPFGLRLKYRLSSSAVLSLALEGFKRQSRESIDGTCSYDYGDGWSEGQTRSYDPFSLELSGSSVLGGVHYSLPLGSLINMEFGAAAGWSFARFEVESTWSHSGYYRGPTLDFSFQDGGSLEGRGSGNGFTAQASLQLNRMLGRRFGFFIEAAGTYCRLGSLEGKGREIRLGIPGEVSWEGPWGIKEEKIDLAWGSADVSVPTNYWEGWITEQRTRDFFLDLSGARLAVGFVIRL